LNAVIADFAAQGLRVLGVARSNVTGEFPDDPLDALFEVVGLIGFLDPLRSDVPAALKEANAAGIRVMMITGDHPQTARAIAAAAGIDVSGGVLSGVEIAALPLPTLRERLRQVRVFARVAPEQKFLLVEALKANGEIVAMTGDGVNDAPALEAAHIGIAMGQRGAAVAREAADLILLDDSFASIVGGVRLGRWPEWESDATAGALGSAGTDDFGRQPLHLAVLARDVGAVRALLAAGAILYALLTPWKEIALIREGNAAAAVAFSGVLVGLAVPLAVSLSVSTSLKDIALWGVATVVLQLLAFRIVDMILTGLPQRIREGEIAAAVLLVGAKLSTALILAAALTG
jgi:uncharacterized membrane protein YjfL (UPF0719 family)/soluble P-type ATPase